MNARLDITRDWRGEALAPEHCIEVRVGVDAGSLVVELDAPYHADPAPPAPAGPLDRLWEHEVVEAFFASDDDRYLEVECGPHGHWLCLAFDGVRNAVGCPLARVSRLAIADGRWCCTVTLPREVLPVPIVRANACAIHGRPQDRRYASATRLPGDRPDFHQPRWFQRVSLWS